MKLPQFQIRTLMIVVAGSALVAWGLVRFPGMNHIWRSIFLGILLGAASLVVPLVAVPVILHLNPRWWRRPVASDPPEPKDGP
jgi:ABC-type glycerol-3-phosphate transport system permease component